MSEFCVYDNPVTMRREIWNCRYPAYFVSSSMFPHVLERLRMEPSGAPVPIVWMMEFGEFKTRKVWAGSINAVPERFR